MRRVFSVCLIALALGFVGAGAVVGQETPTSTTQPATTTTSPPIAPTTTAATTPPAQRTTTTTRATASTTSTTLRNGGRPVPPPASGPTQTLVPDLLGSPVSIQTTTTLVPFAPRVESTIPTDTETAAPVASQKTSPSGATLILATIAWLASLGGLLLYVEDQRSSRWRHLAR